MASLVIDFIGSMHAKMNCIKKENELLYLTVWLFHMLLKGLIWKLEQSDISDYPINDLYDTHTVVSKKFVPKQYKSASDNADWYYENVGKVLLYCGRTQRVICFQKCLHLIGGFCARSSSHKIQSARKKTCCRHISSNRFDTSLPFWHIAACLHCSLCWTAYSFTSHLVSIIFKD